MSTLHRILVPTDGSEPSDMALEFAMRLARAECAEVVFCSAVDLTGAIAGSTNPYAATDVGPVVDALEEQSKDVLGKAAARASAAGVPASTVELAGPAAGAIADAVDTQRADAIVMGTHGLSGVSRFFLGSVADGVLRRVDVPVFVVSQSGANVPADVLFSRIAVALDDSDPADAALEFALDLAQGTTKLVLAHIVNIRELYELAAAERYAATAAIAQAGHAAEELLAAAAERARRRCANIETVVIEGEPVASFLDLVQTSGAGLAVIGTHGRRGLRRMLLGSVAEGVVRQSPIPVVVLRRHRKPAPRPKDT